jgi:formamidopyrimidine-DNA glycosylase
VPELPEVETVVRDLRPLLVGRTIRRVERLTSVALRRPWVARADEGIQEKEVRQIDRRGKWILINISNQSYLIVHLGMTGQLTVVSGTTPRENHTHFVFALDGGQELRYRDVRRFGSVQWFATPAEVETHFEEQGIGPEPFGVDPQYWAEKLQGTSRNLKATLLDQAIVAGVGNIYADEALFVSGLHPSRRSRDLSGEERERLRQAVELVLTRAIAKRGSTIRDYVGGSGLMGGFQDEFAVYGRTSEPCTRCGCAIVVERYAGRSSHFCPTCQPPS